MCRRESGVQAFLRSKNLEMDGIHSQPFESNAGPRCRLRQWACDTRNRVRDIVFQVMEE